MPAMRTIFILLLIWSTSAWAQQKQQQTQALTEASAVQTFIRSASAACQRERAQACVDAGWKFAAKAPDRGLTLPDLQDLRRRVGSWFARYQNSMSAQERNSVALGLLVADGIGMPALHAAFDADRNGQVTKRELLADVALDDRPLGAVLSDAKSINRAGIARKLGLPAQYLEALFP
jgi:hypothetical protein